MLHRKHQNQRLRQELEDLRARLSDAYDHTMSATGESVSATFDINNYNNTVALLPTTQGRLLRQQVLGCMGNLRVEVSMMKSKYEELMYQARQQAALEEQFHNLQSKQRYVQTKKRATVLEHKRRLLEQDPDILQHSDDDDYTLEDQAATLVQRIARGVLGRSYVQRLRPVLNSAATMIQGIMRGHLGRSYATLTRTDRRAVTNIQRVWRGHVGRSALKAGRTKTENNQAALKIQRRVRGCWGRRRVEHKRGLRESAKRGSEVVGIKQLFHEDIVELARAINTSLHDKDVVPPPNVVLGLLKVVALMLEEDEDSGAVTQYSSLGVQSVNTVEPVWQYTWHDALRLLRRSSKLLRRLRQVAEGPVSKRPRTVNFCQAAVQTYHAVRCDHMWNVVALGSVGRGAKACQHLMMWVNALQEVFIYQREFAEDLGSDRIPWIERVQKSMRHMRHLEISRMIWEHAFTCLLQVLHESKDRSLIDIEQPLPGNAVCRRGDLRVCVAERAVAILRNAEASARHALAKTKWQEEEAQRTDLAREVFEKDVAFKHFRLAEVDVNEKNRRLQDAKQTARNGITVDRGHLRQCLDELAASEVTRRDRWTSLEMCRIRNARSAKWRGICVKVWEDIHHQLHVVGEMEAASALATEDLKYFIQQSQSSAVRRTDNFGTSELEALQQRAKEAQTLTSAARIHLDQIEEQIEIAHAGTTAAEVSFDIGVSSEMVTQSSAIRCVHNTVPYVRHACKP